MVHHYFIPHHKTHKRAHLISWKALAVYTLIFFSMQFGFKEISQVKPDVLGISASVDQKELITLTNVQRQKSGLPAVTENSELDQAALEKGKNMFAENYWAHFSPSGKSPWDFIQGSGYKFSYAGENLARNFYTSKDVVDAWMASTMGHRENILNSHYSEIGMAVLSGKLNGQDTILVVQEFGKPADFIANKPSENTPTKTFVAPETKTPSIANIPVNAVPERAVESVSTNSLPQSKGLIFDPYLILKSYGIAMLSFVGLLVLADMVFIYGIRRKPLSLFATRHVPHMALMAISANSLVHLVPGSIL